MFTLSKLLFLIARPGNLLVLILLLGAALLWHRSWKGRRLGRGIVTAAALAAFAAAALPLGEYALRPLENRFPVPHQLPQKIDGIVVLGAAVKPVITSARGQITLAPEAGRLTTALSLARDHPEARVIFTGGSGLLVHREFKEAAVAGRFLVEMGLDPARLTLEDESRDTYENALFSQRVAKPKPGERWVLVTSAVHMPRAVGVFRAVGWDVIPYPVDYRTTGTFVSATIFDLAGRLADLDTAAKEWLGLIGYRLLGRTNTLFPGPEPEPPS
jgi:uncharacterized SAM-binding protein YcdF (DUF218 family)